MIINELFRIDKVHFNFRNEITFCEILTLGCSHNPILVVTIVLTSDAREVVRPFPVKEGSNFTSTKGKVP